MLAILKHIVKHEKFETNTYSVNDHCPSFQLVLIFGTVCVWIIVCENHQIHEDTCGVRGGALAAGAIHKDI